MAVVVWSQLAGLALLAPAVVLLSESAPVARDLGWGAAAGVGGGIGVILLYRGWRSGA